MKKYLLMALVAFALAVVMPQRASAQKFALVDMEYVLSNPVSYTHLTLPTTDVV